MEDNLIPKLLSKLQSEKLYDRLGLAAERIIKSRTRKGIDMKGNRFQEYSEGYLKLKEKKLRNKNPSLVDLVFSPRFGMMDSINHVVAADAQSVQLHFATPEKELLASYHNIQGAGKSKVKREFWGIELQSEIDYLVDEGYKEIQDIIFKQLPDK